MNDNQQFNLEISEVCEVDLFSDELDERLNASAAGCTSTLGSASSISTAGSCLGSFGTIGSACTASAAVVPVDGIAP